MLDGRWTIKMASVDSVVTATAALYLEHRVGLLTVQAAVGGLCEGGLWLPIRLLRLISLIVGTSEGT